MNKMPLPRWSAPLIGVGLGVLLSIYSAIQSDSNELSWEWRVLFGAALGGGSGVLVCLLDVARRGRRIHEEQEPGSEPRAERAQTEVIHPDESGSHRFLTLTASQATAISRVVTILAILICPMPLLGLEFAALVYWTNRQDRGWAYVVSVVALGIAVLTHVAFASVLILAWLEG